MALSLADKMAEDKDVMVFFDIEGVEVVMKDSDDITFEAFESSKTLLGKLLANNVLIEVCPMCLKAKGYTMEEVMSGINLAEKDDFFNFTNGRILTLDY
jgi:predicted peroxiredoxin